MAKIRDQRSDPSSDASTNHDSPVTNHASRRAMSSCPTLCHKIPRCFCCCAKRPPIFGCENWTGSPSTVAWRWLMFIQIISNLVVNLVPCEHIRSRIIGSFSNMCASATMMCFGSHCRNRSRTLFSDWSRNPSSGPLGAFAWSRTHIISAIIESSVTRKRSLLAEIMSMFSRCAVLRNCRKKRLSGCSSFPYSGSRREDGAFQACLFMAIASLLATFGPMGGPPTCDPTLRRFAHPQCSRLHGLFRLVSETQGRARHPRHP